MPVKNVSFDRPVTRQEVERLQAMAKAMRERPKQQVNHPLQAAANFANDAVGSVGEFVANRREQKRREALISALTGKSLPGVDPTVNQALMQDDPDSYMRQLAQMQAAQQQAEAAQRAEIEKWQREQQAKIDFYKQQKEIDQQYSRPEQFTLGAGQVRYDAAGNQIAAGPEKNDRPWWANPDGTVDPAQMANQQAGRTSVNVNTGSPDLGKLSNDYGYIRDPQTGQPVIDPETGLPKAAIVPGSKAWQEQQAAEQAAARQADVKASMGAEKVNTILDATGNIKNLMDSGTLPDTGTASNIYGWWSGTDAGKVRSYVKALQSGVALNAMMRLKEASSTGATGFGQLSNKELDLLISDIGALDPTNTDPEIFRKTVERIESQYKRVADDIRRNVSPERIQQLGLDVILPLVDDAQGGGQAGPAQQQGNAGADIDEETQRLLDKYGAR